MKKVRINKYLASLGLGSRRKIDELIEKKQVKVNGELAELGMKVVPANDVITAKGQVVSKKENESEAKQYWLVYKPVGVISSAKDPEGRPTVVNLVESDTRLYPVGRLDQESEGLILLTNDGELTYHLTHPKFEVEKEYLVWVNGQVTDKDLNRLRNGVLLSEGRTNPAQAKVIFRESDKAKLAVIITEGRNRQIRRMAARVGLTVMRLKRVRMASLHLGDLGEGESRQLTQQEVQKLKKT